MYCRLCEHGGGAPVGRRAAPAFQARPRTSLTRRVSATHVACASQAGDRAFKEELAKLVDLSIWETLREHAKSEAAAM